MLFFPRNNYNLLFLSLFRYEVIGKLETNTEDTKCIFELLNVTHIFDAERREKPSGNGRSDELVKEHFRTLTKQQLLGLYQMYKFDFEAFEYDFKGFLNLVAEDLSPVP